MANVKKYTKAACGHLFKHYERAKALNPETGQLEYVKFANQQIDPQRSHLNYNLATHQTMRQGDFIRKLDARERQLNEMAAGIVPLHEEAEAMSITAQKERNKARELREKQESYILGTAQKMAQKIADKRIEEMFGDIPDKRGKRLEAFCDRIKFSDGKTALQAFEEQEKALKARSRGHGR